MSNLSKGNSNSKIYIISFSGIAIATNIVLGILTKALGIPLYLDTLGTVLTAALIGPVPGIIVGLLSNIITGLISSVTTIPFALVNGAVGLVVGLIVRKWGYNFVQALIAGLLLSVICPLIGTPIGILVYGGLSGSVSDILVLALVNSGQSIFAASFIRNIASNLVDKIGTCLVAWALLRVLPLQLKELFTTKINKSVEVNN